MQVVSGVVVSREENHNHNKFLKGHEGGTNEPSWGRLIEAQNERRGRAEAGRRCIY